MIDLAVIYHAVSPWVWRVAARLPACVVGSFIRRRYADRSGLVFYAVGNGCRFELLGVRPMPALCGIDVVVHNLLPFDVLLNLQHMECTIDSTKVLGIPQNLSVRIPASASARISIPEIPLSEQQINWIKALNRDFTFARINMRWRCKSKFSELDWSETFDVTAFINKD